ncbi:MAG: hypothetical protein U1E65_22920 [Myxococcota bacterium]
MMLRSWVLAAPVLALGVAGCGGFEERATQIQFNSTPHEFWDLPFPSDLRIEADGSLGFKRFPLYGASSPVATDNALVNQWLTTADARLHDGWGLSSGIFFRATAAIDPSTLPAHEADTLSVEASAFLVALDGDTKGTFLPVTFAFHPDGDRYAPTNLISAIPVFGFTRKEHTTYALVLTDKIKDTSGKPIGGSRSFHDAFSAPTAHFLPLVNFLKEKGFDTSKVVGAAVFRTMDPSAEPRKLAAWAEALPEPTLAEPWKVAQDYGSFQVLTATYTVPVIQSGARPYKDAGEGRIIYGSDGNPVIQGTQKVRLAVTIPKMPMPAAGFPITMYLHGSGGEWYQGIERGPLPLVEDRDNLKPDHPGQGPAEWLGRRGIALAGFDFPLHGNRNDPPDTSGLVFYNLFGNIDATIDNFNVAVVELLILSRLLTKVTIDAALTPTLNDGGAADHLIRFDPAQLMAFGQSMGSTLGVPWATLDPRLKSIVVSGGGGILAEIGVTALEPIELRSFVESALEFNEGPGMGKHLDIDHPLLHALQNLWDMVDPVARAAHVTRDPFPGIPPKNVFLPMGFRDGYFHPRAQAAIGIALGVSLAGTTVEPIIPERLALAGHPGVSYPVSGNLNGKTVAAAQYMVPFHLGHYVLFDLDEGRHQYTCFLATSVQGEAKLGAPGAFESPCP